jgi:hypothetical protein
MAMTLRLSDEQTEAHELTDRLANQGAQRYAELLHRLGE